MLVPSQGEMKALRPRHQGVGAFWGAGVGRGGSLKGGRVKMRRLWRGGRKERGGRGDGGEKSID